MYFADRLTLDAPRRTREGYLVGRARAARTGVYDYAGSEIDPNNEHGLRDKAIVKVLRDDKTVFDRAAVQSFIGKPITNDHPATPVTADNWRDHARGAIMGALRDGDYVAFDYLLTDATAIAAVDAGKRELSNGYGAELEFGQFTAPDGTICDARQSKITGGNHVALVDRGRAGPDCAIKDLAVCDALTADGLAELQATLTNDRKDGTMPHILIVDGLQVPNVSDEAKACIEKLQGQLTAKDTAIADAKAEHDKAIAKLDAKVEELEGKVVDQAQIDALADAKADTVAKAKAVCGDKLPDTAGKTVGEVRRMALDAKGIDCTDKSDDYIEARFDALTADAETKVEPITPKTTTNDAANDIVAARAARNARLSTAYKGA
jgi:uncharacterized protein